MRKFLGVKLLSMALFAVGANAQRSTPPPSGQTYDIMKHQKVAMTVLMSWGIGSVATGIPMVLSSDPLTRDVGIQNIAWGAIDAGIAGFGLYGRQKTIAGGYDPETERRKFQKVLGINALLDIGYMGGGIAMMASKNDKLYGHGLGILTQGAFLFLFDGVHYFIAKNNKP